MALDQAWVYHFNDGFLIQLQQEGSLLSGSLDPAMVKNGVRGAIDHHERLGSLMLNDVISPYAPVSPLQARHSRRAVTLQSSAGPLLFSDEDTIRSMTEPGNGYRRTLLAAAKRRKDKHVIDAALGTATTAAVTSGSGVITYGTQALPSARVLGSGIAITLTNIIAGFELHAKAGASGEEGELTFAYAPGQLRDLMAITQASSSDFTKNRIHDKGTINGMTWEGFKWVQIADVLQEDASTSIQRMLPLSSTTRSCVSFHRGAIGMSVGKDVTTMVDPRPDLESRPTQIRVSIMLGCVRVWEGGVVQYNVLEN